MAGILTEEQIAAISRHKVVHDIKYCLCPCFDALISVAEKWEDIKKTFKLEGALIAFGAKEVEEQITFPAPDMDLIDTLTEGCSPDRPVVLD